jgi:hypothetical protein
MISIRTNLLLPALCIAGACRVASTPINHHGVSTISFEEFNANIDIPDKRHKFRLDGAVNSLDEHMQKIIDEFGLRNFAVTFANPSIMGRTSSWTDGQGTTWAVSYAVNHADSRVVKSVLAHEKYHALHRLAPMHVPIVHSVVESLGFAINWNQYDEEVRAQIVGVVSLYAQGVRLEQVYIIGPAAKALEIVQSSKRVDTSP